jgi:hypothetical protein
MSEAQSFSSARLCSLALAIGYRLFAVKKSLYKLALRDSVRLVLRSQRNAKRSKRHELSPLIRVHSLPAGSKSGWIRDWNFSVL